MNATLVQHIEIVPGPSGPKPRIAGTRIRVVDVVVGHQAGASPREMVEWWPHVTEADIYAALAFYCDNRAWVDELVERDRTAEEDFRRDFPHLVHQDRR